MKNLIYFLQETGLYKYAEEDNLILDDVPSDKLINAWNKHINHKSVNNIPKVNTDKLDDEHELLVLLKVEGKSATSNKFMELAKIPSMVTSGNARYRVKSCSIKARDELALLIKNNDIIRLINCVEQYYNSSSVQYKKTFSNLLLDGDVQALYDDYKEDGSQYNDIVPKFRIG